MIYYFLLGTTTANTVIEHNLEDDIPLNENTGQLNTLQTESDGRQNVGDSPQHNTPVIENDAQENTVQQQATQPNSSPFKDIYGFFSQVPNFVD